MMQVRTSRIFPTVALHLASCFVAVTFLQLNDHPTGGGTRCIGPAYLSPGACERFPSSSAVMTDIFAFVFDFEPATPALNVRDQVRAHFTSYPGQLQGTLANYSPMCLRLRHHSAHVSIPSMTKALVHPLSTTCGVGELIAVTPKNNRWNEFVHTFSSWLLLEVEQHFSISSDDALPYIVHNLSLYKEVSGFSPKTLMRLGGGFHGAAWEAISRKLQTAPPGPALWTEIMALCDRSGHNLAPWIEKNCKHHAVGHGVMHYFMIRSLNATARSLYSPCFPLQRYSQALPYSIIQDAEELCMSSPLPLGCCDGMYHHYFKYASLKDSDRGSADWAWPCTLARWPEPCFQRAFVTHAVLYRWVEKVSDSAAWPEGIACNDTGWPIRVQRACVQALSTYTAMSIQIHPHKLACVRPTMPYMLPPGIAVRYVSDEIAPSERLSSLCFMISVSGFALDERLWHACIVGAVQAFSMYSSSQVERLTFCEGFRSAPRLTQSAKSNSVLLCMRAFTRAGTQNNLGFTHYWNDVDLGTTASNDTSKAYYTRM